MRNLRLRETKCVILQPGPAGVPSPKGLALPVPGAPGPEKSPWAAGFCGHWAQEKSSQGPYRAGPRQGEGAALASFQPHWPAACLVGGAALTRFSRGAPKAPTA